MEDELYQAVLDNPAADAPRQVYADWLLERGDPRGAAMISADARAFWEARLGHDDFALDRGLVRRLTIHNDHLVPELVSRIQGAGITELQVTRWNSRPVAAQGEVLLAMLPHMGLRQLYMRDLDQQPDLIDHLVMSPSLRWIETLWLSGNYVRTERLAASPYLSRLQTLVLANANLSDEDAWWLGKSRALPALRTLNLAKNKLTAPVMKTLLGGTLALTALDVSHNPLGLEGLRAICAYPGLQTLILTGVVAGAAEILAHAPALGSLRHLVLAEGPHETGFNWAELQTLIDSPYLSRNLELELDGRALGMLADHSYDAQSAGGPVWSGWVGEPHGPITQRFRVKCVGYPE